MPARQHGIRRRACAVAAVLLLGASSGIRAESDCFDGIDNDGDTYTDCGEDWSCCIAFDCPHDSAPCMPERRCVDGMDDDLDGAIDCADPDCAVDPACPEAANCADGLDNDGDTLVDCLDCLDCVNSPGCAASDCDGDGRANGADCRPLDATTFDVPPEVTRLVVNKPAGFPDVAQISWTDMASACGTSRLHDVVTGDLRSGLWTDRGFASASCLQSDFPFTTLADPRLPSPVRHEGYYYLVRADTVCGKGTYGNGILGGSLACP